MTYEQRERIFSKDYISLGEFMEITGLCRTTASQTMKRIRRQYNRLGVEGKIHVQDYFDFYGLNPADYRVPVSSEALKTLAETIAKELASKLRSGAVS